MESILLIAGIHLLAVMSPGPDMVMTIRNSMLYSKKTGFLFALGLAFGVLFHFSYSLYGMNWLMAKSIVVFTVIKFLGAVYLMFLGYKSITAKEKFSMDLEALKKNDLQALQAINLGFWTNALNPKTVVYFIALFTQFIQGESSMMMKFIWGLEVFFITFLWFSFVSFVLTQDSVRRQFLKFQGFINKLSGAVLIAFGIKILTEKIK